MEWGREFTRTEKILTAVLSVILTGLCYYQFLYRPVTREIKACHAQRDALMTEFTQVQNRIIQLQRMRDELDRLGQIGYTSRMPSYNSVEAETSFLNTVLAPAEQYSISFANVTRTGSQIRRNVTLRFTAREYPAAESILTNLSSSADFRCLLGDLRYSGSESGLISVNVSATFFETMAGGTPDAGLPR